MGLDLSALRAANNKLSATHESTYTSYDSEIRRTTIAEDFVELVNILTWISDAMIRIRKGESSKNLEEALTTGFGIAQARLDRLASSCCVDLSRATINYINEMAKLTGSDVRL